MPVLEPAVQAPTRDTTASLPQRNEKNDGRCWQIWPCSNRGRADRISLRQVRSFSDIKFILSKLFVGRQKTICYSSFYLFPTLIVDMLLKKGQELLWSVHKNHWTGLTLRWKKLSQWKLIRHYCCRRAKIINLTDQWPMIHRPTAVGMTKVDSTLYVR